MLAAGGCADPELKAERLVEEFGSFAAAVSGASHRQYRSTNDLGAVASLAQYRDATRHWLRSRAFDGPVLSNWHDLLDYLAVELAHRVNECARVLYLNRRNALIRDEVMSEGTIDSAPIYIREVMRRSLELGASALILVHNHPSGDSAPSQADISVTRAVIRAGIPLSIAVLDHLIIGAKGHFSLRSQGLI